MPADDQPSELKLFYVRPALRRTAERIVQTALDRPTRCVHVPAPFVSALAPEAGSSCAACAAEHLAVLLLDDRCSLCRTEPAQPGLIQLPAGEFDLLTRLCASCVLLPIDPTTEPIDLFPDES